MLNAAALADYSQGRLDAGDQTALVLARSLAEVRRWCRWHVTPERTETVTLDGTGGPLLRLPTKRLATLTAVTEDGTELDTDDLEYAAIGLVRKKSRIDWTSALGGVVVTMTHGFSDAPDFEAAVLSVADRRSQAAIGGTAVSIGPFRFNQDTPAGSAFTAAEMSILSLYRLERDA